MGEVIKTAKQILYEHAEKAHDGFMTGQVGWIVEAMHEFANQEKEIAFDNGYASGYKDAENLGIQECLRYQDKIESIKNNY